MHVFNLEGYLFVDWPPDNFVNLREMLGHVPYSTRLFDFLQKRSVIDVFMYHLFGPRIIHNLLIELLFKHLQVILMLPLKTELQLPVGFVYEIRKVGNVFILHDIFVKL